MSRIPDLHTTPHLFTLRSIGSSELGYITVIEHFPDARFSIKRVFWTYFTPDKVERGRHAHKKLEQILIAVHGIIEIKLEDMHGGQHRFKLDNPNKAVFVPKLCWERIKFSHDGVLLCLTNNEYDESEYIRDYDEFKKLIKNGR